MIADIPSKRQPSSWVTMVIIAVIVFMFSFQITVAQGFDLGSWNILHIKYSHNEKLSFFAEAQLRSLKFYHHFHYYEYKGGVNYKVHKNVKISLGGGSYQTYREGGNFRLPQNNAEFRLWPQLIFFQNIWKLNIEQRYRAEFRWTSNGYRNRFRYRLGLSYPFGKEKNGFKPFQVSVSDEVFFTDREPYFERNRLLLAFNYKPTKAATLQMGYLHQFDYKLNDEIGRDFLVIGLYIEIFRKKAAKPENGIEINDN